MFTGIVEETGSLIDIGSGSIKVKASVVLEGTKNGDSIAVNGVCLTVTEIFKGGFRADVMPQTLRMSALGELKAGNALNLERAMASDGRFGGHIVSGHIDGVGTVKSIVQEENAIWFEISAEDVILKYIIHKGSIAINGISLTVADLREGSFKVSIIPHTLKNTMMIELKEGSVVNLENDLIAKYVERLLGFSKKSEPEIDMDFLRNCGF